MPKDNAKAAQYYQQALAAPIQGKVNPANRLWMFYYDGEGVEQDYAKEELRHYKKTLFGKWVRR